MCYSLASVKLGDLGSVIAWPLFLSAVVIASTIRRGCYRRMEEKQPKGDDRNVGRCVMPRHRDGPTGFDWRLMFQER
jgi:hypothetical protein